MKYLPLGNFGAVTNALNFSTLDCHVIGGCDIYTTKAAGSDKKLYKTIENSLESQYESLVRFSASLSPPCTTASDDGKDKEAGAQKNDREASRRKSDAHRRPSVTVPPFDLSRASPFGPLSQTSARRTYAYLIATLNAAHPDYDFSNMLRPADFKKEPSLKRLMHKIDSTLQNLRPHKHVTSPTMFIAPLTNSAPTVNSAGNEIWGPKMWSLINSEMKLQDCEKYSYAPEEDPFEDEEGAIWSMHYFFFNKQLKRVCYLYLRALSIISHSPLQAPMYVRPRVPIKSSSVTIGDGAGKRAAYWLGSRDVETESYEPEDDDDDAMVISDPADDELDVPRMDLDDIRTDLAEGHYSYDNSYYYDDYGEEENSSAFMDEGWHHAGGAAASGDFVRGVSEEIAAGMEI